MKRLLVFALAALILGCNLRAGVANRPPNIVFVLADDLGWRDTGCQGSTFYETANIDRLAREGMRFTNAYAACPVCSPTRASLMTGRYPARLHLTDIIPEHPSTAEQPLLGPAIVDHLPQDGTPLAQALQQGGYRTALIGKWHLGDENYLPTIYGFDVNIAGCGMGHPSTYFSPYHIPTLSNGPKGEYLTDRLSAEAVNFITQNKDRPFFLYLAHYAVHVPLQAKPDMVKHWHEKKMALPTPEGPEFLREGDTQVRQRQDRPVYAAMIQSLEESVGRVLATLDELKLTDHTVVVFFSDNGGLATGKETPTSNLPLRAGKGWLYEGGVREPMIVRWPGVTKPGSVSDTPVISTDFYPTLLAMAGLPQLPKQTLDGISIAPALKGQPLPERPFFWHYPHYSNSGGGPAGAMRLGDFKLVESFRDMHDELYNLKDDPGERHDLAAQNQAETAALRDQLHQWRASIGAEMPKANPAYVAGEKVAAIGAGDEFDGD